MRAGHDHSQAPANFNTAFGVGIGLNMVFVAIEAFYDWQINSLALLADAGHNLSDMAGLVLPWCRLAWSWPGRSPCGWDGCGSIRWSAC